MIFKKNADKEQLDEEKEKLHHKVTKMMLISFVGGIVVMFLGLALGLQFVTIIGVMQVFFVFGLGFFMLNIGDDCIEHKINALSLPLPMMIVGGMILIGCAVLSLEYNGVITMDDYETFKGWAGVVTSFAVGLAEILPAVYFRTMLKKRCTYSVPAECERLHVERHTSGEDNSTVTTYCPVWHYYHDNSEYHSLDNAHRADKKLPTVGETYEIKIDPDKPERLLSPYCHIGFGFRAVIGVLALAYAFLQVKMIFSF